MITKEEAEKLYADLIQLRRSDVLIKSKDNPGAIEIHHITPVSCGGLDNELNKIALYAKEHFMAHVYLYIIHRNTKYHDQMICALMNMCKGTLNGSRQELRDYILASEEYQLAKEDFGKYCSKKFHDVNLGDKNRMYGKHWYYNPETLETKMYYSDQIPNGWKLGRIIEERDRFITLQKIMNKANNIELRKRINACRTVFFTMYYQYYLKFGFEKTVEKYNLNIERTALLHLFKKYVSSYKRYNRRKFKTK